MSKSTLTSIAILKVNWERGRNYLDSFVPFVAESVRLRDTTPVDPSTVQADLESMFGLLIPRYVVDRILKRTKKRGNIKSEGGNLVPNPPQLASLGFKAVREKVLRMYEDVATAFVSFCRDKFALSLSEDDAASAILSFLEDYHLPIIASRVDDSIVPPLDRNVSSARFLVGSFIRHLEQTHSPRMEAIDLLARGIMVANAIFLPDPDQAGRGFASTQVFFDTAFLIFALGYAGPARCHPTRELLQLLYSTGARLACFPHTYREIRASLDASASRMATAGARAAIGPILPSVEYFLASGFTSSDVFLLSSRLETDLANLRIRIIEKPPYNPHFVMDEKQFAAHLDRRLRYRNPQARDCDVDSVSAVVRIHQGRSYYAIENAPALFITTNRRLVRQSIRFFYQDAPSDAVAPFLTDHALTNLLWLKRPNSAPDLPRNRVIADCYAATEPDERLWSAYVAEVTKLESLHQLSADDYYLLRHDLDARTELMDRTRGNHHRLTADTVPAILTTVKGRIRQDLVEQVASQARRASVAETAIKQNQADLLRQLSSIEGKAVKLARITVRCFQVVMAAGMAICSIVALPRGFPPFSAAAPSYLASGVTALVAVLSIVSLVFGTSFSSAFRRLELALAARIHNRLVSLAGIADPGGLTTRTP